MKNTELAIAIRNPCNFSCSYCVGSRQSLEISRYDLGFLEKFYRKIGPFTVTSFECGSGEPSLHPQIKDIIRISSSTGAVSIPTNNSIEPSKWTPEGNLKNLLIRAALHPQNEENIDRFTHYIEELRDRGAAVRACFVAHPERLKDVSHYRDYFCSKNIPFNIVSFTGEYNGNIYPAAYSVEELNIMGYVEDSDWYQRLHVVITDRNFKGIPCLAGCEFFYIDEKGALRRCLYDSSILSEPLLKSVPCVVKKCGCRLYLQELNTFTTIFWNGFRGQCGYPLMDDDSKKLTNEEIYQEKLAIYHRLLREYK
jgi:MoaA/NifB/PqqE/SkfB family radical SAM enzyme